MLAVTENKKEDDNSGGWTSYPPLSAFASSAVPGWHTTISGPSHVIVGDLTATGWYPLGGTITVHFWVE